MKSVLYKKDRNGCWLLLPHHYGLFLFPLTILIVFHFDKDTIKMLLLCFGLCR